MGSVYTGSVLKRLVELVLVQYNRSCEKEAMLEGSFGCWRVVLVLLRGRRSALG